MVQEDLLERGLAARQRHDRVLREGRDQGPDRAGDLEPQRVRSGRRDDHARDRRQRRRGLAEGDLDRLRAEVAQLRQRALVDEPAGAQDADAVAQRLDLAE